MRDCGALEYTHQAAVNEGNLAIAQLDLLPSNAYTEAMRTLTVYSLSRLSYPNPPSKPAHHEHPAAMTPSIDDLWFIPSVDAERWYEPQPVWT